MGELDGRVAVVVGGAHELGRASARALARAGATVVVADADGAGAGRTAAAVRDAGGPGAWAHEVDVRSEASVATLVAAVVERHGRLDVAHNVTSAFAGGPGGPAEPVDAAGWDALEDAVVLGTWRCLKHELGALVAGGGRPGVIVSTTTADAVRVRAGGAAAAALAQAVVGLTRTAALEYGDRGIRVHALAATPGGPAAAGVGATVAWLAGDAAAELNGLVLPVGR